MAGEFDVCWSTVIAATDTHAAFGEAPDNGWVQRCRLGSGHDGIHASDAGVGPRDGLRLWLQWTDTDDEHRLTELESCPATDGPDLACVYFAGHGGPHRCAPTSANPRFGSHYRPDTTVGLNGSRRAGSVATAESLTVGADAAPPDSSVADAPVASAERRPRAQVAGPAPTPQIRGQAPQDHSAEPAALVFDAPRAGGHRSRHSDETATDPVRSVDAVLVDLVDLLSELAAAIKAQREA